MSETTVPATQETPVVPDWVGHICRVLQKHAPTLTEWETSLWEGGVRIDLQIGGQPVGITLRPRVDEPAWGHTDSLSLALQLPPDTTLPNASKKVVEALFKLIRKHDQGGLTLPTAAVTVPTHETRVPMPERSPDGRDVATDAEARLTLDAVLSWRTAHEELSEELQENAYIALRAMLSDDLYPHVVGLGETLDEAQILDAWSDTKQFMKEGRAPQKLGLYCHIPYCTVECTFCYCGKTEDFVRSDVDQYVDQLVMEADLFAERVDGMPFTSVYFGGGTPSLLTPPAMRRLFQHFYSQFHVPEGTQVVFEGNPDSLKPNKVDILAGEGRVTRLTIGIQTLDPDVQKYVRRYNKHEDVEAALRAARSGGIPHINFDCIAGLEGQSMESFQRDVRYLLSLEPDSIHLNGFRPLPRTNFRQEGRAMSLEQERLRDEMLAWGHELLATNGYANQLQQGPHRTQDAANIQEYDLRRQNSSLVGLGFPARAHAFGGYYYVRSTQDGFVPELRHQNTGARRWRGVRSDHNEEMHKFLVTNIRNGVDRAEFAQLFGQDVLAAKPEPLKILERLGAVDIRQRRVHFHTGNLVDSLIYRVFCYSDAHRARAMSVWGHEFDRSVDYRALLNQYVPQND